MLKLLENKFSNFTNFENIIVTNKTSKIYNTSTKLNSLINNTNLSTILSNIEKVLIKNNNTTAKKSNLITKTNTSKRKWPYIFPDFIDTYDYDIISNQSSSSSIELFGLTPIDYDGGILADNITNFIGEYSNDIGEPESASLLISQLSTPLIYILFMLLLYVIIIFVVFISALYSHRKRIGYRYNDFVDSSSISSDDTSDEACHTERVLKKNNKIISNNELKVCNEIQNIDSDVNLSDINEEYLNDVKVKRKIKSKKLNLLNYDVQNESKNNSEEELESSNHNDDDDDEYFDSDEYKDDCNERDFNEYGECESKFKIKNSFEKNRLLNSINKKKMKKKSIPYLESRNSYRFTQLKQNYDFATPNLNRPIISVKNIFNLFPFKIMNSGSKESCKNKQKVFDNGYQLNCIQFEENTSMLPTSKFDDNMKTNSSESNIVFLNMKSFPSVEPLLNGGSFAENKL